MNNLIQNYEKFFGYFEKIRLRISSKINFINDTFIVDTTPIEICKLVRAMRSDICSTNEIKPDLDYCSAKKMQ